MKISEFLKEMLSANLVGISSKRVAGFIGWLVALGISIACTVNNTQAPDIVAIIIFVSASLLGLDSVTAIWRGRKGFDYSQSQDAPATRQEQHIVDHNEEFSPEEEHPRYKDHNDRQPRRFQGEL